jgi:hypothetical protein
MRTPVAASADTLAQIAKLMQMNAPVILVSMGEHAQFQERTYLRASALLDSMDLNAKLTLTSAPQILAQMEGCAKILVTARIFPYGCISAVAKQVFLV